MPRKVRELLKDLKRAGFYEIPGAVVKDRIVSLYTPGIPAQSPSAEKKVTMPRLIRNGR
jgi:hypothetical protein